MIGKSLAQGWMVAAAVVMTTGAAAAEESKPLALGATAPLATVKMKSANDGKAVSLADVKGAKGTLVVFTCNHCPFAQAWEQRIVELGNSYAKKGIGVVLVNANDPTVNPDDGIEEMQKHVAQQKMAVPYVVDDGSQLARAFGASRTPEAFLFDKAGKLAYHGTIDDNHKDAAKVTKRYLKDALDAVVAGKAPALQETKSVGCGIKFKKVS